MRSPHTHKCMIPFVDGGGGLREGGVQKHFSINFTDILLQFQKGMSVTMLGTEFHTHAIDTDLYRVSSLLISY